MVSHEDILKIAKLAKLYVAPEELDTLTGQMNQIIEFADEVTSLPAGESDFDNINGLENIFREDEPEPSFDREEILKNTDSREGGYFLLRRRM